MFYWNLYLGGNGGYTVIVPGDIVIDRNKPFWINLVFHFKLQHVHKAIHSLLLNNLGTLSD